MIIRDYFHVPATLVTNAPDAVLAFREEYGHIIYKSVSGERSIVSSFTDGDADRLGLLAGVPVQFQEYVPGVDVRVHVVGEDVFATCVESGAIDYRYDDSGNSKMSAITLPDEVCDVCVKLTARLGLELSGIDLRYAEDGRIICFEVNPSPAYSVYEAATGQPIAAAIARRLLSCP
jgi:glutathione synthase/RimK-type ligase-like ATP-grasp enzyme